VLRVSADEIFVKSIACGKNPKRLQALWSVIHKNRTDPVCRSLGSAPITTREHSFGMKHPSCSSRSIPKNMGLPAAAWRVVIAESNHKNIGYQ
jgi:hypothetical protein